MKGTNRVLPILLTLCFALSCVFPAFAQDAALSASTAETAAAQVEEAQPAEKEADSESKEIPQDIATEETAAPTADPSSPSEEVFSEDQDPAAAWREAYAARDALSQSLEQSTANVTANTWNELYSRMKTCVQNRETVVDVQDLEITLTELRGLAVDLLGTQAGMAIKTYHCAYNPTTYLAVYLGITEYYSDAQIAAMQAEIDRIAAVAAQGTNDQEKAMLVHDQLVLRAGYDTRNYFGNTLEQKDYEAYGILVDHCGVCQGYAYAYSCILEKLGIPSILVTSYTMNHAWNLVQLGGKWYHVDCTWDDALTNRSDVLGRCGHENFLVSTNALQNDSTHHSVHQATDFVAYDHETGGNIVTQATDTTYDAAWWCSVTNPLYVMQGDWYYLTGTRKLQWRDSLADQTPEMISLTGGEYEKSGSYGTVALLGDRLYCAGATPGSTSSGVDCYLLDSDTRTADYQTGISMENVGLAGYDDRLYAATGRSADGYSQTVVPATYTVSFSAAGAQTQPAVISVLQGGVYGALPVPQRVNDVFLGWFTQAEGGTEITAETTVSLTGDQTLYAHWKLHTPVSQLQLDADGIWRYTTDGIINAEYTGLVKYGDASYYVQNGVLVWGCNGLVYSQADQNWYYVQNSVLQTNFTDLVYYNNNWYYVQNGVLTWSYTGLFCYGGTWYYIQNGALNWGYTGLTEYYETNYYVQNGVLVWGCNGLVYSQADQNWYYVQNSILQTNFTDLVCYNNSWYYVQNGVLTWSYTGLFCYGGTWYYIQNGALNWGYTGLTEYYGTNYYVQNGVLAWGCNGLVYSQADQNWYYVQNSILQQECTDVVLYNGTWYYVSGGRLDWSYTGVAEHYGTLYYVQNGVLNWNYTGTVKLADGSIRMVRDGVVQNENE
jgi:uncharacterized repeat protein (TIGR02543 family)